VFALWLSIIGYRKVRFMTDSEQCSYAQVAFKIECLALRGFGVSIDKCGDLFEVRCNRVKVQGSGVTLSEALGMFIVAMEYAGWSI